MAEETAAATTTEEEPERRKSFEIQTAGQDLKQKMEDKDLRAELNMTEHKEDLDELLARLESHKENGLTSATVQKRLEMDGPNKLTPPATIPEWLKLVHTQTGFFALLLWAGAILCFVGYGLKNEQDNLYLGIVLSTVTTITGIFEYFQERKSSQLMESFKDMMPKNTLAYRNGEKSKVAAETLVVGDIVEIRAGDQIPADIRVIMCSEDMRVDHSSLTGEPDPLGRSPKFTDQNPLETKNLCFFGTLCPRGMCKGVVVNTGDRTVMGRIAGLAAGTDNEQTPINKEILHFVTIVSGVAIFLGISFLIIGFALDTDPITNLVFMIGIIVANVPEGLLATVTVCLTLTAKRMSDKQVLVKNLEAVETLGSTTCICSDKTGTLTRNDMTVVNVVYDMRIWDATDEVKEFKADDDSFFRLCRCGTICNTATFEPGSMNDDDGKPLEFKEVITLGQGNTDIRINWKTNGDASESAMIKFTQDKSNEFMNESAKAACEKVTGHSPLQGILDVRAGYPVVGSEEKKWAIPFNSKNKYQVSVHLQENDPSKPLLLAMKGAPERIITRCSTMMQNGEIKPFGDEEKAAATKLNSVLAKQGQRVLGFCELVLDQDKYKPDFDFNTDNPNFPLGTPDDIFDEMNCDEVAPEDRPLEVQKEGLCFLGFMALQDPPRAAVPDAVDKCKQAGIKVIMVTGDHPDTAQAISKKVGIIWGDTKDDIEDRNTTKGLKEGDDGWEDPDLAPAIVVPGWTFTHETPEHIWDDILNHGQVVFARTSPQQKLIIVENCKRRKEIVAVTGDGVNDAPALKAANIGVAMGIMGSDVSKEAADMILMDDNFASIVNGVEEGRLIFDNLKKSIAYTLSSNIPEISPFLAFITIKVPLPLSTVLILCVDLGTDMVPAISMAWENPEADIMRRAPRDAEVDRLVTRKLVVFAYLEIGVIQCIAGFYAWMTILNDYGYPPHTLPGLGAYDNWGKQVLYCKLGKGLWKNENGAIASATTYTGLSGTANVAAVMKAQADGYMFWDKALDGVITSCQFPVKNLALDAAETSGTVGVFTGNGTTVTSKSGDYVVTRNAAAALHANGYAEYLPFRGRRSPFYNKAWTALPITDTTVPGLGADVLRSVANTYQPAGFWSIASSATGEAGGARGVNAVMADSKASLAWGKDVDTTLYKTATFATYKGVGQAADFSKSSITNGEFVPQMHAWMDGSVMKMNVASRMMQKEALHHAQCGGFICIIVVQWADLMICKTRWLSIRQQGMENPAMNFGLLFETILGSFLCYAPGIGTALGTRPLRLTHWFPGMPFMCIIFMYDEIRKYLMRQTSTTTENPDTKRVSRNPGWLERNTYY
jgi:sodium/potassium-transporting ATPase subunit alpha